MTQFMRVCFEMFIWYWAWREGGPVLTFMLILISLRIEWYYYRQSQLNMLLEENGISLSQKRLRDHFNKRRETKFK